MSQADRYQFERLAEGSVAALDHIERQFTPARMLQALEACGPPSGRVRPRELIVVEESILRSTDRHGNWLHRVRRLREEEECVDPWRAA